jgi:hypothetical protein
VLIPQEILTSVVFIFSQSDETSAPVPRGTAFLVAVESRTNPYLSHFYLVTARHTVAQVENLDFESKIRIRANTDSDGAEWMFTDKSQWFEPKNDDRWIDVAVLPLVGVPSNWSQAGIPTTMFVSQETIDSHKLGIGDELYVVGLFPNHFGRDTNVPIVRVGNIAAMPSEPVSTELGAINAYLIESRSIGGLSGSPVFVAVGPVAFDQDGQPNLEPRKYFVIGLLNGHFDARDPFDTIVSSPKRGTATVNVGIGLMTPIVEVLDILNSEGLAELRSLGEQMSVYQMFAFRPGEEWPSLPRQDTPNTETPETP